MEVGGAFVQVVVSTEHLYPPIEKNRLHHHRSTPHPLPRRVIATRGRFLPGECATTPAGRTDGKPCFTHPMVDCKIQSQTAKIYSRNAKTGGSTSSFYDFCQLPAKFRIPLRSPLRFVLCSRTFEVLGFKEKNCLANARPLTGMNMSPMRRDTTPCRPGDDHRNSSSWYRLSRVKLHRDKLH